MRSGSSGVMMSIVVIATIIIVVVGVDVGDVSEVKVGHAVLNRFCLSFLFFLYCESDDIASCSFIVVLAFRI